jgi:hypothetical protein
VGLERGPLSLVSTTEELLDRKIAAPVYKIENTAVRNRHADHVAPSIRKSWQPLSPASGGRSIGIVRLRTKTMEFFFNDRMNNELESTWKELIVSNLRQYRKEKNNRR